MLRELRTSAGVVVRMFISMMIFMLGLNCFVLCRNVGIDSVNSVDYEYMYMLKFPEESFPESGEVCYAESLPLWLSARLFAYRCPRPPLTRSIPGRLPMLPAVQVVFLSVDFCGGYADLFFVKCADQAEDK